MAEYKKRLIYANDVEFALQAICDRESGIPLITAEWLSSVVRKAKTVDAVEVVRCKDCRWAEYGKDYEPYCNHWKSGLYANIKDDDFCSYGERKDNG